MLSRLLQLREDLRGLLSSADRAIQVAEKCLWKRIIVQGNRLLILGHGFWNLPFEFERLPQHFAGKIEAAVHLDCFAQLRDGFV